MKRKYEYTGESKTLGDGSVVVRQIRRLSTGKVGGWIEGDHNLCHTEGCWVANSAMVYGEACVSDNATVSGRATVSGHAVVSGHAAVRGDAAVWGRAAVGGYARVSGRAELSGDVKITGAVKVRGYTRRTFGQYSGNEIFDEGEWTRMTMAQLNALPFE